MKRAVVRVLMVFGILTALGAAQAAIAGEPSPCQGVNQNLGANIKNKTDLARAITKQLNVSHPALKISSTTVLRSFASGNWSIVYVAPDKAERVFVFYAGNPLTSRYVTLWGGEGATTVKDEPIIKNWVLKNAPGIPPKLASCFAWYVTKGRGRCYVTAERQHLGLGQGEGWRKGLGASRRLEQHKWRNILV